jgi:hypothetical protein
VNRNSVFISHLESILLTEPPKNPFSTVSVTNGCKGQVTGTTGALRLADHVCPAQVCKVAPTELAPKLKSASQGLVGSATIFLKAPRKNCLIETHKGGKILTRPWGGPPLVGQRTTATRATLPRTTLTLRVARTLPRRPSAGNRRHIHTDRLINYREHLDLHSRR